jgi:hypothetical protein
MGWSPVSLGLRSAPGPDAFRRSLHRHQLDVIRASVLHPATDVPVLPRDAGATSLWPGNRRRARARRWREQKARALTAVSTCASTRARGAARPTCHQGLGAAPPTASALTAEPRAAGRQSTRGGRGPGPALTGPPGLPGSRRQREADRYGCGRRQDLWPLHRGGEEASPYMGTSFTVGGGQHGAHCPRSDTVDHARQIGHGRKNPWDGFRILRRLKDPARRCVVRRTGG